MPSTQLRSPRTLILVLLTLLAGTASSCGRGDSPQGRSDTLDRINRTGVLKVGYIVFPPTITKDPNTGELGGHFVATIREIARQAEWDLQFTESEWATFAAGLQSKQFDVSIAPTFVTVPRAKSVAFTRPLFFAGNSAIVRRSDNRFDSIDSIDKSGIKVAVTQGEAGHEYATSNFRNAEILVHSGGDQALTFQTVVSGRADVALGDSYMTSQFAAAHPEVKDLFADNPYNLTPVSWAVRYEDQDLLTFLNAALGALDYQGHLATFEREAGAHWLHLAKRFDHQ